MKVIMLIGCIFTISSAAAQMRNIAGVVIDTFSKEYLPSATVSINGKVISANGKGVFSVALPVATMDIRFIVSYSGYKTDTTLSHSFQDNYIIELIPVIKG